MSHASQVLGKPVEMSEVKNVITREFAGVFQTEIETASFEQFNEQYHLEMEKEHAST